jgi:hypothetical protein
MSSEPRTWTCRCGRTVTPSTPGADVACRRGQEYNGSGQRLRADWRDNPSLYDDEIGDLDGYELACLRKELGY